MTQIALERSDGSTIARHLDVVPPAAFEARHLRAFRSARQALERELRSGAIGASRWAQQLLRDVDEAVTLAEGSIA